MDGSHYPLDTTSTSATLDQIVSRDSNTAVQNSSLKSAHSPSVRSLLNGAFAEYLRLHPQSDISRIESEIRPVLDEYSNQGAWYILSRLEKVNTATKQNSLHSESFKALEWVHAAFFHQYLVKKFHLNKEELGKITKNKQTFEAYIKKKLSAVQQSSHKDPQHNQQRPTLEKLSKLGYYFQKNSTFEGALNHEISRLERKYQEHNDIDFFIIRGALQMYKSTSSQDDLSRKRAALSYRAIASLSSGEREILNHLNTFVFGESFVNQYRSMEKNLADKEYAQALHDRTKNPLHPIRAAIQNSKIPYIRNLFKSAEDVYASCYHDAIAQVAFSFGKNQNAHVLPSGNFATQSGAVSSTISTKDPSLSVSTNSRPAIINASYRG